MSNLSFKSDENATVVGEDRDSDNNKRDSDNNNKDNDHNSRDSDNINNDNINKDNNNNDNNNNNTQLILSCSPSRRPPGSSQIVAPYSPYGDRSYSSGLSESQK